ncbi:MAG: 3-hydroxyacyl-CoA dehydrogenase family protein, partial [Pseudomonadota bacterium]|nr:3-hydroxyacyl-CoA dehydrogenase family protein [Pseudomonadota bacterium]
PDPEVEEFSRQAAAQFGSEPRQVSDQEILERCIYPLVNIGATILEEGIALRASDIDLVYLNGYGFPVWRGGPMHWAGTVGLDTVGQAVGRYFEQTGRDHWSPASLLNKLGAEAKTFEAYDAENN